MEQASRAMEVLFNIATGLFLFFLFICVSAWQCHCCTSFYRLLTVSAFAMLICFFSLVSSMYTNVHEQTKEIGVVLALGLPRSWLTRVCITLSSSFRVRVCSRARA
jgi:hypothetical protein